MANSNSLFYVIVLMFLFGLSDSIADSVAILRTNNELGIEVKYWKANESRSKIDDIYEFVQLYPTVVNVEELTSHNVRTEQGVQEPFFYTLGDRIAGDSLVGYVADNYSWSTPQDVRLTLTYPVSGVGKQITYVALQVDQSSDIGQAYVVDGGLHQRSITIVVDAYTTNYLNYDAQFYGV